MQCHISAALPDLQLHGGNTLVGPAASVGQERLMFGRISWKRGLQAWLQAWSPGQ